jgi:regulator of protease activity HflC (stomatin/prohibitin superfamily)
MKAMPLNPLRDGSLITGDSNIVHAKWTLTWRITDPEAFLTNLGNRAAAAELVRLVAQQGIVHAAARMGADDFLRGVVDRDLMIGGMQRRLDDVRSGLTVDQLTLEKVSAPMRVAGSFDAVTTAESERAARVVGAQQDNARILGETAGEASAALLALISEYEAAVEHGDPRAIEELDSRIATAIDSLSVDGKAVGGEVARLINAARAYRTQIVEKIASEAQTFEQLLPQFERNPALVLSKLWEDAREGILTGKDVETFYTVPGQLELQLNRDPALQKERQKEQLRSKRDEERRARDAR